MSSPPEGIVAISEQLRLAVLAVMDPNTPQGERFRAYQVCEDFKENSPQCAQCGMHLSDRAQNPIVRHFGLQLVEHCIRIRWNQWSIDEKVSLKVQVMVLLSGGTLDLLEEEMHIKDAVSRIVVEMIKREWPQQWPSLMEELDVLCTMGPTQTELVLLILLRLAEDILHFQNVPNQRRREIVQGLNSSVGHLHAYFLKTLSHHFTEYQRMRSSDSKPDQRAMQVHCRVTSAVVNTLSGFVEWIGWSYLAEHDGQLLQLLCLMLSDAQLQLVAAECLLLICNKKGPVEERKPLMLLFTDDAMSAILSAAMAAAQADLSEYHYAFLKRLCQVLVALGNQLTVMWGDKFQPPNSFVTYLQAIFAFTSHPSQMLASFTHSLWASFLRHPEISQNAVLLDMVPQILDTTRTALLKVGFPSQSNSPSCSYARLDFDCDEDFNAFFCRYRCEVGETIRQATCLLPCATFRCAADWLQTMLSKPVQTGAEEHSTLSSPIFLEWDALALFLDCVMTKFNVTERERPPAQEGVRLLQSVLAFHTQDPLILSCILSCTSALFPFITEAPEILPAILDKILTTAVFNLEGQTKATRSKAVKNVRRHACSGLVKIAREYPSLLLPGFDQLCSYIGKLTSELSSMEEITLTEALILISNHFKYYEKQSSFLGEILKPIRDRWLAEELRESVWDAKKFMTYVGLDQAAVEPSSEDVCGINRSQILFCVNTILAVLKRSCWPEEPQSAESGGFLVASQPGASPHLRNPVFPHLMSTFDNVLALIRTLNALWLPELLARRHSDFQMAYDLLEVEKKQIMGQIPPSVEMESTSCKQPLERMQSFLATVHSSCHHIIGNAGPMLGHEFYSAPLLASSLMNAIFSHLDFQPEYRIKYIIRAFVKPYVQSCPRDFYSSALIPVLSAICPYMLQRLSAKWQKLNEIAEERGEDGEDQEEQEVLEEQIVRQLTRDYLEFIGCIFRERKGVSTGEVSEELMEEETQDQKTSEKDDAISELGKLALSTEGLSGALVMTLFQGLAWNDTMACFKCIKLCWPAVRQLLQVPGRVTGPDAQLLLEAVLRGLQQHGEHEGNQAALIALALTLYEHLRPVFPEVKQALLEVPKCTEEAVKEFDIKLLSATPQKQMQEKRKKDCFKKLIKEAIGQNVGQRFRREVHIKNLPPLFRPAKVNLSVVDKAQGDIGLCALFTPK